LRNRILPRIIRTLPLALVWGSVGCELTEITLAESEDVLVAEGYIRIGDKLDQVTVFLHWTLGTEDLEILEDAEITVFPEGGQGLHLLSQRPSECLRVDNPEEVEGVCFGPGDEVDGVFLPGTRAEVEIRLPDGRELWGGTQIPEDIELIQPRVQFACALAPKRQLNFIWNRSPGAWAYSAEAEIDGLRLALEPLGIEVEEDSVSLLGLAVSESDTAIAFPKEFGVFNRFELQQEVALALQEGLPEGALANVGIAALDQNYVNWVRGGTFNPSGAVRISSLRGDGIGVLASAVRRSVRVLGFSGGGIISCLSTR
jgi:hypothetical protein